jgi:hypothetical protein
MFAGMLSSRAHATNAPPSPNRKTEWQPVIHVAQGEGVNVSSPRVGRARRVHGAA